MTPRIVTAATRHRLPPVSRERLAELLGRPAKGKKQYHEHDAQVEFFRRVDADARTQHLLIYAVPNAGGYSGGFKANAVRAARMKAEGVRKGPPDINVDEARGGYHGLRIEMKHGKNRPTPDQRAWHDALQARGYAVHVCYSADAAWACLLAYLDG